nr:HAD family hydrolase [uncultured Blautia sp.]
MIKLVASDLDGTLLLNGAQSLPEELFPLIKKLKELGILFVAASGRQYANMKRMFAPVVDDMAFISENGGLAIQNEKVLYQDSFPQELVREIVEAIYDKKDADFTCSTKDFYYIRPKTEHYRDLMLNVVKNNCKEINSFDEMTEPCMKVAVYERGGIQEDSIRYWNERFGDRCTVVTSGFAWVDFIPFGTNKAKGLREYQKLFGIRPEECVVFGDEYNDIAMLESVPYSFAMAHAKPGVKKAAAYQTDRVEHILEKLIRAGGNIEEVIE